MKKIIIALALIMGISNSVDAQVLYHRGYIYHPVYGMSRPGVVIVSPLLVPHVIVPRYISPPVVVLHSPYRGYYHY